MKPEVLQSHIVKCSFVFLQITSKILKNMYSCRVYKYCPHGKSATILGKVPQFHKLIFVRYNEEKCDDLGYRCMTRVTGVIYQGTGI